MPTTIVAGNWKMNTSIKEATELVSMMKASLEAIPGVEKVVCPPFISLCSVKQVLNGTNIKLGAQNMHHEDKGAYTGEVSPAMLKNLCEYVILGHSERRKHFGEDDSLINKKVTASLKARLRPILCVGERPEEREEGRAEETVASQIRGDLQGITSPTNLVLAYEPVWAIGTGKAATGEIAQSMMAHIRRILSILYGEGLARDIPLLYGGSVTPDNIDQFIGEPDINGALVGGASLNADGFVEIVRKTSAATGSG